MNALLLGISINILHPLVVHLKSATHLDMLQYCLVRADDAFRILSIHELLGFN